MPAMAPITIGLDDAPADTALKPNVVAMRPVAAVSPMDATTRAVVDFFKVPPFMHRLIGCPQRADLVAAWNCRTI